MKLFPVKTPLSRKQKKDIKKIKPYFDKIFYTETYPDIDERFVNPLEHYYFFGWKEGRDPAEFFSTLAYLDNHVDVKSAEINPLVHYARYGRYESRKVVSRPEYGRLNNGSETKIPDVGAQNGGHVQFEQKVTKSSALDEFREDEKRKVTEEQFCEEYYLRNYKDIRENRISPYEHFMTFGWREHRNPNGWFDLARYNNAHFEEIGENDNPFTYYLMVGKAKGHLCYAPKDMTQEGLVKLGLNENATLIKSSGIKPFKLSRIASPTETYSVERLNIDWVIPDFSKGGGGHMTIFRIVRWLEIFGHCCTLWVYHPEINATENEAYQNIIKHFQTIRADVNFITSDNYPIAGDILIATSWQTVSVVKEVSGFKEKFYFVQDFEPYFYAKGARSLIAENTYRQGLSCICASSWLKEKLEEQYGAWAKAFMLAFDREIYSRRPTSRSSSGKLKIAVYARIFTERRAVELALAGLELLARERNDFEVHLFGSNEEANEAPFDCVIHGLLSPAELSELYNSCDIGICFSATNYSLVPQEMMACGLPVMEINVESTRAIFPESVVSLAEASVEGVKSKIAKLIDDPELRRSQAEYAYAWASRFSWETSSRSVENAFIEKLEESSVWVRSEVGKTGEAEPFVSVVIPTLNGGDILLEVIEKVKLQRAPWSYELIVIDSSSTDGTPEKISDISDVQLFNIDKEDFGHGKTRNYGVSLASGKYVAFLTQDAIPLNEYWLYNLVVLLEHYPEAAGVFGKHIAHDNAKFFTRRDIEGHFDRFDDGPISVRKDMDLERYNQDIQWRQYLHFYSDNSSCLRKSAWQEIPYRDVKYGEDQLWAFDIIEAGYEKLYCPSSVVKHSHEYTPDETYERSKIEGDYFRFYWGYHLVNPEGISRALEEAERSEELVGIAHGVDDEEIQERKKVIESRLVGLLEGQSSDFSLFNESNSEKSTF